MTGTHEHIITQSCEGAILTHCISNPHSYSSLHSIIHTFFTPTTQFDHYFKIIHI